MPLDIQRRNSIAQQGKDPAPEEPRRSTSRDQGPGGSRRSAAQQLPAWGIATVRERKRIPTGGEAQLRRDAVIGASATRPSMVAWSDWERLTQAKGTQGTRVASFDLPPTTLHTFDIQMPTGKNGLHPKIAAGIPGGWCSWEVYEMLTSLSRWSPWQRLVADGQPVGELGYG